MISVLFQVYLSIACMRLVDRQAILHILALSVLSTKGSFIRRTLAKLNAVLALIAPTCSSTSYLFILSQR